MKALVAKLMNRIAEFYSARDGNIAIIFALAALPIVGLVGASVDYSRANSVRAHVQSALDSTALMMWKSAATTTDLKGAAKAYFVALLNDPKVAGTIDDVVYTPGSSSLTVKGSATLQTDFMGIVGFPQLNITSSSTVKWGNTRLRVALVLDTTGSMSSAGKISALQSATKSLLTQLQNAATAPEDVYVSIIPFSKNVNVGSGNSTATWIDWTDWEAEPASLDPAHGGSKPNDWNNIGPGSDCPFSSSNSYSAYGFGCAPDAGSTTTVNKVPSNGSTSGYICPGTDTGAKNSTKVGIMYNGCYNSITYTCTGSTCTCTGHSNCSCSGNGSNKICKQPSNYYEHAWRPAGTTAAPAHSTWNGCVTDRGTSSAPSTNPDYDRVATAPVTNVAASLFPAEQNSYCSPAIVGLNYNWPSMKTQVDNLYPLGATNQPIGLVWGWQSLVGGGPLTAPAKDSNYDYSEVIILLSDGLNTLNRWNGNGFSTNTSVDNRMYDSGGAGTCANIKAAKITIYSIQVNTDGDPTSTLLKNCATDASKFFMLTSATQIVTTFTQIGTQLTSLRVAQ
jgi:Flp pilus assembly protein TadG